MCRIDRRRGNPTSLPLALSSSDALPSSPPSCQLRMPPVH